ncbi:acyltransferase family protein [Desertibaculum subflavum]|uniref:acyltransferase family protein n=1 Tax=Desertibaculum subflavum TaxID=2268458 RepID=UPI0013C50FF3
MIGAPSHLQTIQALRAVAALGVLLFHAAEAASHNAGYAPSAFSNAGAAGVDLFFVISGFVMVQAHRDWFGSGPLAREFLARRLIRIVPLYWLATALIAALLLVAPALFQSRAFDAGHVALSFLFVQSQAGEDFGVLHGAGWSLCFEMYFYLLFFVCMPFGRRAVFIGLAVIFAFGIAAGPSLGARSTPFETFADPMLLEFLAGMLLAEALQKGRALPRNLAWPLLLWGLSAIAVAGEIGLVSDRRDPWRVLVWGVPAIAIVWGAISVERPGLVPRWLVALGDASYSLYLLHLLVLPALGKAWAAAGLTGALPRPVFLACGIGLSVAASLLAFLHVERPMTRRLRAAARIPLASSQKKFGE